MITNSGRSLIPRSLAGVAPHFVESVAIGIGETDPALGDTALEFEVGRYPVEVRRVSGNTVIYKVSLPESLECKITEAGVFSYQLNEASGIYTGGTLSSFTSSEGWYTRSGTDPVYVSTNARLGGESLTQAPGSEYSFSSPIDLSGYSVDDDIMLSGYLAGPSGTCYANITFASDEKEITYSIDLGSTQGYVIRSFSKQDTGSTDYIYFDWSNIREIRVGVEGTMASFQWDALRVLDSDTQDPDKVLVGRETFNTITKTAGVPLELQYSLSVIPS